MDSAGVFLGFILLLRDDDLAHQFTEHLEHANKHSARPANSAPVEVEAPPSFRFPSEDSAPQNQSTSADPRNQANRPTAGSDFCAQVRLGLESRLGRNKVRRYLGNGARLTANAESLQISASDRFTLDMTERQIGEDLKIVVTNLTNSQPFNIRYTLESKDPQQESRDTQSPATASAGRFTPGREAGNPKINRLIAADAPSRNAGRSKAKVPSCPTIEDFLVGQCNKLAFGAIRAVLESTGPCAPVYVHGSCGVGKTHLLRAAAQRYRKMVPGSKVRYITGEAFTNSFVQAVRTKTVDLFEKKFRGLDVLCLDDVHLVAGKQSTQHELLQIFNTLSLSGAKILLASDAPPNEVALLSSGLASRFAGGVVVRIDEPDRALGLRLGRQCCTKHGMSIDDTGIEAILDRIGVGRGASVRELEGAMLQIQAVARLMDQNAGTSPSVSSIHKALELRTGSTGAQRSSGPISMDLIMRVVLDHLGVTKQDLSGPGRHKTVVLAREVIVYIARELTTRSFPEIAHAIGRPNHSTVITAYKRIKDRVEGKALPSKNPRTTGGLTAQELVDDLIHRVREGHGSRA